MTSDPAGPQVALVVTAGARTLLAKSCYAEVRATSVPNQRALNLCVLAAALWISRGMCTFLQSLGESSSA